MDALRCVSKHEAAPVLRDGRTQPRWKNARARLRAPSSGRGRSEIRSEDAHVNTTHYPAATVAQQIETHTLSVLVDNEPGVLARVIGLFSGRGYNIESLTVSETEHEKHLSRITIVTRGTPMVIEQIKSQLDRLVPVHRVIDMTVAGPHIERELAMVKVRGKGEHRMEALRLADAFRARVIDASTESFVFEITGASEKIESFVALMIPLGLVEVSRTGIVAIGRGPEGM
jgi:acetolactate synthase I/III small subunit